MVHFYNLEPEETQEHHTFTMASGVYQMHHGLNAGEQKTIEFTASEAGIFDYLCVAPADNAGPVSGLGTIESLLLPIDKFHCNAVRSCQLSNRIINLMA